MSKTKLGGACGALDQIVATIDEKEKNVSSIEKSKLDWDKYTISEMKPIK